MSDRTPHTPGAGMSARERILGRLRAARPAAEPVLPDVAALFASRDDSAEALVDRFQRAIEAWHAEVHRVTDDTLGHTLSATLGTKGVRRLAVGRATLADQPLADVLRATAELYPFTEEIEEAKTTLFHDIDAGFTVARGAIAETGTLILWPGPDEPRTLSLVPPLHVVLLDAATIHPDLHAAMLAENWRASLPTNVVLVSGPSKTADIQQTLAYGAHGPKEVVVLLKMPRGTAL